MQKHSEPLVTITIKITESQNQKLENLMMVLYKNRSEIVRDAIDLMTEIHDYDLNRGKPEAL